MPKRVRHDMNMKKLKIGLLIGLLGYLFIGNIPVEAGALSLSLDPPIIEINALPPSTVTSTLSIQNKSDNQVHLIIQVKPFRAKLENGELEYFNSEDSLMLSNIKVLDNGAAVESVTLGPSQQKNLILSINIPQDTKTSDYYFSIIFVSENSLSPTSNASLNQLGIATNVLLSVGQKAIPDAIIEEFSSGLFFEKGPVPFTIRLKNKGIHFIKPKGNIFIKNMFGQSIGKLDLMSVNILSDSTRAIPNALWKEDFLLGFYTATLNTSLSNDGPNFTRSINFFAFPFQGMIVIIIVAIAAIIITNRLKKIRTFS